MSEEKPMPERVSILEVRMDYHDKVLQESLDRITTVADSLTTQVARTNSILERFEEKLEATAQKVQEWDTTLRTLIKVIIVISVLIGGAWSVFEFVVDHKDLVHSVQTSQAE
jgi:uncharacterized coiled-coil protein SlyX